MKENNIITMNKNYYGKHIFTHYLVDQYLQWDLVNKKNNDNSKKYLTISPENNSRSNNKIRGITKDSNRSIKSKKKMKINYYQQIKKI